MRARLGLSDRAAAQRCLIGIVVAVVTVLVALRGYDAVESPTPVRWAIGESLWWGLAHQDAYRSGLLAADAPLGEYGLPPGTPDLVGVWHHNILRYACPGAAVLRDVKSGGEGAGALRFVISPPCTPAWPSYLVEHDARTEQTAEGSRGRAVAPSEGRIRRSVGPWIPFACLVLLAAVGRTMVGGSTAPTTNLFFQAADRATDFACGLALVGLGGMASVVLFSNLWLGAVILPVVVVAALVWAGFARPPSTVAAKQPASGWSTHWTLGMAAGAAFAIAGFRIWRSTLWSWDHFAIWGLKARALSAGSSSFLTGLQFDGSAPDYPLGLPAASAVVAGGVVPGVGEFRLLHLSFLVVASLTASAVCMRQRTYPAALMLGLIPLSPIFWDLEGFGLADLPLLAWATAALYLAGSHRDRSAVGCVLCLAMVAATKNEGLLLALVLAPACAATTARQGQGPRMRTFFAWIGLALLGVRLVTGAQTQTSTSFFRGDLLPRLRARLADPLEVLGPLVEQLLQAQWLGAWVWAPLVLALLHMRRLGRPGPGSWLAVGVLVACCAYVAVYFATPEEPRLHILTSLHRIFGPLQVLLLLAVAQAGGTVRPASTVVRSRSGGVD